MVCCSSATESWSGSGGACSGHTRATARRRAGTGVRLRSGAPAGRAGGGGGVAARAGLAVGRAARGGGTAAGPAGPGRRGSCGGAGRPGPVVRGLARVVLAVRQPGGGAPSGGGGR